MKKLFKTHAVEANSLEEFYAKFYRHDRYAGRGPAYTAAVLESGRQDIERDGYTIVDSKSSVTGDTVAWYPGCDA